MFLEIYWRAKPTDSWRTVSRGQVEPDWDNDGLTGREESDVCLTDPVDRDSDDDGLLDGEEKFKLFLLAKTPQGSDPAKVDSDADGLADGLEAGLTTDTLTARMATATKQLYRGDAAHTAWISQAIISTTATLAGGVYKTAGLPLIDQDFHSWTNPQKKDSDGDGYYDGPHTWVDMGRGGLIMRTGEDLDGDGKYEMRGADEDWPTEDDETDPQDPNSHSDEDLIQAGDTDRDGLVDHLEEELGCDPKDIDSDDDGIRDGDEVFVYHTIPHAADSDHDGLPDGFELGLTYSAQGNGQNEYNASWFDHIHKNRIYRFRFPSDTEMYYQFTFRSNTDVDYRSDPNCYDSDFDQVRDLAEYNANPRTDPLRGLVRAMDVTDTSETNRLLLPLYLPGSPPINKNYQIYLNKVTDDEGNDHWETTLPVCLGQSSDAVNLSVITDLQPTPAMFYYDGQWQTSVTVTADKCTDYMGRYRIAEVLLRLPEPQPNTLQVTVDRGQGDSTSYTVGRSRYYVEYP